MTGTARGSVLERETVPVRVMVASLSESFSRHSVLAPARVWSMTRKNCPAGETVVWRAPPATWKDTSMQLFWKFRAATGASYHASCCAAGQSSCR